MVPAFADEKIRIKRQMPQAAQLKVGEEILRKALAEMKVFIVSWRLTAAAGSGSLAKKSSF